MRPQTAGSLEEVLSNKSVPITESGCFIWMGSLLNGGYGSLTYRTKRLLAHRASYEVHKGKIPDGKEIDHLCKVRCCINPNHLEVVTHRENMRRGAIGKVISASARIKKLKTYCAHGHIYDKNNTRVNSKGHRECRRCDAIKHQEARRSEKTHS